MSQLVAAGRGAWVILALICASAACAVPPCHATGTSNGAAPPLPGPVVYVVRRGWHIDIGFSAAELRPPLDALEAGLDGVNFLLFGFGDRHYLLAGTHHGSALSGALWPGAGMILATALRATPGDAFGAAHVVALSVSARGLQEIQAFVWRSLVTDGSAARYVGAGPYPGGIFFAATPRYSGLHTCNTWAAEALRAGELPVRSAGVLFASQLWRQVTALRKSQSANDSPRTAHLQGGLDPSWQTTVVPEF